MLNRARDLAASALLPAFLLTLSILWSSFAVNDSGWPCASAHARGWSVGLEAVDARVEERARQLAVRVEAAAGTIASHHKLLSRFLLFSGLAYLLFASERLAIRFAVFAGVVLIPLLFLTFLGRIC